MSLYNIAYVNNAATIYFYKSQRKNAKIIKSININHLISHSEDRKINQDKLKDTFISIIEYLSVYTKPGSINLAVICNEWKNAIHGSVKGTQNFVWTTEKLHFDHFTTAAHWLYFNLFCRIYPYCEIAFSDIETDNNFKYLYEKWERR